MSGASLGEAALSLYAAAGRVGAPIAGILLRWRTRGGKEDLSRRGERWGIAGRERPGGPLVWVHCASVGETNAVLPLIERLAARGLTLLLTTGTVTAAEVARPRLPRHAIHQFAPIDVPAAVERFLDHWRPDLALFAESELWPMMLSALRRRSVPLAVVNARMSERSFRAWRRLAPVARAVLGRPTIFLAQSAIDAEHLQTLGAERIVVCGNLKFDVPPPAADPAIVDAMRRGIGARPVLLAASTHLGEEGPVIAAHCEVAAGGTRLLTIIAPRHRERGDPIAALAEAAGLSIGRRSRGDSIGDRTDLYLADTIGEMGLWYRLASVAFLGGSIALRGGQNPIEPTQLGVPILHGSDLGNFRDVYKALTDAGATVMVTDAVTLTASLKRLLADAEERESLARRALAVIGRFQGALDRTLEALEPFLAPLCHSHDAAPRA